MKTKLIIGAICVVLGGALYPPILGISRSTPAESTYSISSSDSLRTLLEDADHKLSVGQENLKIQHKIIKIQNQLYDINQPEHKGD
jgi:hypothetical protein